VSTSPSVFGFWKLVQNGALEVVHSLASINVNKVFLDLWRIKQNNFHCTIHSSLYILLYLTSVLRPTDPAAYPLITVALVRHPCILVLSLLVARKTIEKKIKLNLHGSDEAARFPDS
jgi:hypothetical protein